MVVASQKWVVVKSDKALRSLFLNHYVVYKMKSLLVRKLLSECIASFALVFFGTGAIIVNDLSQGSITHLGVAISFGLIVMAMIYTFGDRSGAHMNPAVTIAFAFHKVFPTSQVLPYIISQLLGAFLASIMLKILFPSSLSLGATIPAGSQMQSFLLEFLLSFFLMLTIHKVAEGSKEKGLFAGLAIGGVIMLEALVAGPISGASMNPARSIAPALVSGHTNALWIYIAAPVGGMLIATFLHQKLK
jgi:aquaporin Z